MSWFAQNATVVLVHGAWADGTCWHKVILALRKEGLKVTCAPIPLTSLTEDISALPRRTDYSLIQGRSFRLHRATTKALSTPRAPKVHPTMPDVISGSRFDSPWLAAILTGSITLRVRIAQVCPATKRVTTTIMGTASESANSRTAKSD